MAYFWTIIKSQFYAIFLISITILVFMVITHTHVINISNRIKQTNISIVLVSTCSFDESHVWFVCIYLLFTSFDCGILEFSLLFNKKIGLEREKKRILTRFLFSSSNNLMILSDGSLFIHSFINAYFHAIETFLIQVGQKKRRSLNKGNGYSAQSALSCRR